MSVINRVLRDLDKAGEAPVAEVRAVDAPMATASRLHPAWMAVLALAGLVVAVWLLLPAPRLPSPPRPLAGPVQTPLTEESAPAPGTPPIRSRKAVSAPVETPAVTEAPAETPNVAPAPAEPTASASRPPPAAAAAPAPAPAVIKEAAPANPVDEAWRQASRALEQGRSREARPLLAEVLRQTPAHAAARQALTALLLEAGDKAEALRLLEEGRGLHPADPWYPRSQAQLLLQEGQPARAAAALKSALGKASGAEDWALFAGIAARLGRHAEAAAAWQEALRAQPGNGVWWIGLGVAQEHLGQKAEAAQAFQRALQTRIGPDLREYAAARAAELQ